MSDRSFEEVVKPVIEWLRENKHPHHKVVLTSDYAELLEGNKAVYLDFFDDEEGDE